MSFDKMYFVDRRRFFS